LRLGRDSVDANALNGYIDSVRVTKGLARYPEVKATPSAALVLESGDVSVLNFEGANNATSTTDLAGKTWTFNGNAKLSTDQFRFGSASLYCDGNGDYINAAHADFAMGTGDFTVEGWFYRASDTPAFPVLFDFRTNGSVSSTGWNIYYSVSGGNLAMYSNVSILSGAGAVPLNTWTHVAVARRSGILSVLVNGVVTASVANTTNFTDAVCRISSGSTDAFNGYIDGVRITKGYARYALHYLFKPFPLLKGP
jgi:hypothetical protein